MVFLVYFLGVIQAYAVSEIVTGEDHQGHPAQDFAVSFAWPFFAVVNALAMVQRLFERDD